VIEILADLWKSPLLLLPRFSLSAFANFKQGYSGRMLMEKGEFCWGYSSSRFHESISKHFCLKERLTLADTTIVASFFLSEEEAFRCYFKLLEEFLSSADPADAETFTSKMGSMGFAELIREIRKLPAMWIGYATFLGCCAHLMGDERAFADLGLAPDYERTLFADFKNWVESEKSGSTQFRPWFKVIEFWSIGDCGHSSGGAYSLFFKWLDSFAEMQGHPGLFRPASGNPE
jgi:hypothetical protein